MRSLVIPISQLLIKKGKTIAVAESCTGGLLSNLLTSIPGSSQYFLLGMVAYSNQSKISLLNIPAIVIKRYGAVSAQVCRLMAKNIRRIASSSYAIGISGIAGPGGGTATKPVGTVFISVASKNKVATKKFHFTGTRLEIKRKTAIKALSILKRLLKDS
jgi:PncC family amidohydrolase